MWRDGRAFLTRDRRILTVFLAGGALLGMVNPAARGAVIINDVSFTSVYDPSSSNQVFPNSPTTESIATPKWGLSSNSGSQALTLDKDAMIASSTLAGTRSYTITSALAYGGTNVWTASAGLGTTIEFSLKVDSLDSTSTVATAFSLSNGSNAWSFSFGTGQITTSPSTSGSPYSFITNTGFNTYRITLDTGGKVSLYINGSPTPVISNFAGGGSSLNQIQFGDTSNTFGGTVEWGYIAFTNEGAFAPVPEPSAMGFVLIGVGMIACKQLRKRATCR